MSNTGDNRKRKSSDNSITRRKVIGAGAVGLAGAAVAGTALTNIQQPFLAQSSNANPEDESGGGVLRGQVAIVTGAGRGIGGACAVALARAGAEVVVLDIGRDIPLKGRFFTPSSPYPQRGPLYPPAPLPLGERGVKS